MNWRDWHIWKCGVCLAVACFTASLALIVLFVTMWRLAKVYGVVVN